MQLDDVIAYLANARVGDLSKKLVPGDASGPLDTGKRRYEIELFTFPPGELTHNIQMENHISTHVEAPSHFVPISRHLPADDVSELPLHTFFGMAVLVDCKSLAPRTAFGPEILDTFGIKQGDIALIGRCPYAGPDRCCMAKEGAEYLLEKKIKVVGIDDTVFPEDSGYPWALENYFTHDLMLSGGIPIIEGLANLGELTKSRFLFFGIPANMGGLESFPIRTGAI